MDLRNAWYKLVLLWCRYFAYKLPIKGHITDVKIGRIMGMNLIEYHLDYRFTERRIVGGVKGNLSPSVRYENYFKPFVVENGDSLSLTVKWQVDSKRSFVWDRKNKVIRLSKPKK